MPTIKRKVEMNLPKFIAWAIDNNVTGSFYANNRVYAKRIRFEFGRIVSTQGELGSNETFTVEVEEPITEDTKLFLISRCIGEFGNVIYLYDRTTINSRLKNLPKDCKITHLYIENEDNELQLIWKNGKLVE